MKIPDISFDLINYQDLHFIPPQSFTHSSISRNTIQLGHLIGTFGENVSFPSKYFCLLFYILSKHNFDIWVEQK